MQAPSEGGAAPVPKEQWEKADQCTGCSKKFNLTRRRHHCRFCGKTFCDACSSGREDKRRTCWECSAKRRTAGGSEAGSPKEPQSPAASSSASPVRGRLGSLASDGAQMHPSIMDAQPAAPAAPAPAPAPQPSRKLPIATSGEVAKAQQQAAELERENAGLRQELEKAKVMMSNAMAMMFTEKANKESEEEAKRRREALVNLGAAEEAKIVEERRKLFAKGAHHSPKCEVCDAAYSVTKREHHCRRCFLSVCNKCSPIDGQGVRSCSWCAAKAAVTSKHLQQHLSSNAPAALSWILTLQQASAAVWSTAPEAGIASAMQGVKLDPQQQQQQQQQQR